MAADAAQKAIEQHLEEINQNEDSEEKMKLFSLKQAANYLGISPTKLYDLRRDDNLPTVQMGVGVRILKSDLDEYIMSKRSMDH